MIANDPQIFELFDQFVLMIQGRILFQGGHRKMFEFFKSYGLEKQDGQGTLTGSIVNQPAEKALFVSAWLLTQTKPLSLWRRYQS